VFLTEKHGAEFDHAKKHLPAPREFNVSEKKVGLFARMKSKVTTSVPKELATPKCQEYYDYTLNQAKKLSKLVPASERYITRHGESCKATGEMGMALVDFSNHLKEVGSGSDTDIGPLTEAFDALGETLQLVAEANTENMYDEEALLVSNVNENVMLLTGSQRVFDARKAALKTFCGVKDGKLEGMDLTEAEKNFESIDEAFQPQLEMANECVQRDMQSLLFSLAQSRKAALTKELELWSAFEEKLG
jgi:ABC-type cobalt transport system substrate-binding protein